MKKLFPIKFFTLFSGITGRNAYPKQVKSEERGIRLTSCLVFIIWFMMMNLLFICNVLGQATSTSRVTGNWNSNATWSTTRTGTISTSGNSTTVTGSGTLFQTELSVGDVITTTVDVLFGTNSTVTAIASNTSLTINSATTIGSQSFKARRVPSSIDNVIIAAGHTITVTADAACASITFPGTTSVLSVNSGITLAVTGAITLNSYAAANNSSATIQNGTGSGTLTAGSLNCGLPGIVSTGASTNTLTLSISSLNVSGNFSIYNNDQGAGKAAVPTININLPCSFSANKIALIQTGTGTGGSKLITFKAATGTTINLSGGPNPISIDCSIKFATAYLSFIINTSTFNYNGSSASAQTIPIILSNSNAIGTTSTYSIIYGNLYLNNISSSGASLGGAVSATNVMGDLIVQSGTLNNGGFAIVGANGKTFSISDNSNFILSGNSSAFPTGFSTFTLGAISTVNYSGSGAQTIANYSYGNLTLSNAGIKTISSTNSSTLARGILNIDRTSSQTPTLSTNNKTNVAVGQLRFSGVTQTSSTWGYSNSSPPPIYASTTFFANSAGYLNAGGALDHFDISTISSPQNSGTAITNIILTAQDINNNTVTSFTGTVTYS